MFGPLDRDNDGAISRDELSAMSGITLRDSRTGERLEGEAAIQSWMDRFDSNLDGKIEYPEMVREVVRMAKQQETEQ